MRASLGCDPQFPLLPSLCTPRLRPLTSAPTTSVDAHLLGSGCQGRAPRHHISPLSPLPTLPAQPEPVHATIKFKGGGRKAEEGGGKKRQARCPPRETHCRLLPTRRNHQHKMATRSREPVLPLPSTYRGSALRLASSIGRHPPSASPGPL